MHNLDRADSKSHKPESDRSRYRRERILEKVPFLSLPGFGDKVNKTFSTLELIDLGNFIIFIV